MNGNSVKGIIEAISAEMSENRDYLVALDQVNGDGDLGISMDDGYRAVAEFLNTAQEKDLGRLMMGCGKTFNAFAPSSLGTITSFGFMGMAKALKGKEKVSFEEAAEAMLAGVKNIMEKAGSKVGEKTILDSLYPGVLALVKYAHEPETAVKEAAKAAAEGSEATKQMQAVHGRAAYSAERSIGILDGGSVVGSLIFKGIAAYYEAKG
ncbi:dihydroxyacetone kinase subunit L [Lacrimispora saccharolytica]|uniref:Dak phosphatase n=1 Tax=Lacrimispora saccharolytica (strain ATCC 35040 / DSM 2544 / NRCC 2533 / WM1) TaxID=610130 RepID=D9R123_LACSW|nr:dihydroxyacetone kinase subunit L [Lacrimispora saccharolytica]ADL04570.1 Dak phosphatase [[Clostridium] saccharolyticum WM1]QRV21183.1 dihydroxyacetone kinase subunit L [Lacrimispora saccharolytica]